jgi:hypothetical protein
MLRRVREKKTCVGKAVSLLVPICYRRKIQMHLIIRRRTSKRTTRSLNKHPLLRRKRTTKMVVALFTGVMSIGQVHAQTANLSKRRNLQIWLLASLKEEHLGIVILYLLFF